MRHRLPSSDIPNPKWLWVKETGYLKKNGSVQRKNRPDRHLWSRWGWHLFDPNPRSTSAMRPLHKARQTTRSSASHPTKKRPRSIHSPKRGGTKNTKKKIHGEGKETKTFWAPYTVPIPRKVVRSLLEPSDSTKETHKNNTST